MRSVKKRTDDAVDIRFGIQTKAFWSKWERQWWTTCLQKLLAYKLRGVVDGLSFQKKTIGTRLWRRGGGS